jgi:hypothetical protein
MWAHTTRVEFSVTRKLWSRGWSGVNIDANPKLIDAFKRERPGDVNLWACVGTELSYNLAVFEEPALSTVNKDWRLRFLSENQKISSEIIVPGVSLRKIFDDHFEGGFPDLLSIDAEGADFEVLQSAELKSGSGPQWLLLEADPPLTKVLETPAVAHAISVGYEIFLIMGMSTLLRKIS